MAKIGNESKLILSLAKERMGKKWTDYMNDARWTSQMYTGYRNGYDDFIATLDDVVAELETK